MRRLSVLTAIANPPPVMSAPATDRYLAVDGARLRYRDEGSGPAVLLVHGWALDLAMWDALALALREEFRVVRLDRRGFGLSSGFPGLERDIADLEALRRHLALPQVALLGMSQGARAVLRLAMSADSTVSCLVLDGPPDVERAPTCDERGTDGDVPLAHYRVLARSRGVDAVRGEWAAHPLMRLRTAEPNARRLLNAMLRRYPGTDLLQGTAPAAAVPDGVRPESIAAPALVITGEHDLAPRVKAADLLARRLPDAQRAVIPEAGHLAALDNPIAYHHLVRSFLTRHTTAPL
jgi:pimeloyl-ACP methyl ester carboxylesterase